MKLRKILVCTIVSLCITGCASEQMEEKKEETPKGNCVVTECIKQLEVTNTVEEINSIIGFEGEKNEYSNDYTWELDSKNWITLKSAGESPIIQATIDKDTLKQEELSFPTSSKLQEDLNNGSFTYHELVEKLGGIEGTLAGKTSSSVSYIWVNKSKQTLRATFNSKSEKCTIASFS